MSQLVKFPDMRPATPPGPIHVPPPSGYVQRVPLFPTTDGSTKSRRFERKRLLLWFGIAVAFHAALLLGLWLMPALRIKWEPSPDAWVQVVAVPPAQPASPAPDALTAPKPATAREKNHKTAAAAQPRAAQDGSAASQR
jgi:hypothetical protein